MRRLVHRKAKRKYYSTLQHILLTPLKPIGNLLDDSFYQKRLAEEDRQRLERRINNMAMNPVERKKVNRGLRSMACVLYRTVCGNASRFPHTYVRFARPDRLTVGMRQVLFPSVNRLYWKRCGRGLASAPSCLN